MGLELRMDGLTCKSEFLNHSAQYNHKRRFFKTVAGGSGELLLNGYTASVWDELKIYLGSVSICTLKDSQVAYE